jgi:hypothetical protein
MDFKGRGTHQLYFQIGSRAGQLKDQFFSMVQKSLSLTFSQIGVQVNCIPGHWCRRIPESLCKSVKAIVKQVGNSGDSILISIDFDFATAV